MAASSGPDIGPSAAISAASPQKIAFDATISAGSAQKIEFYGVSTGVEPAVRVDPPGPRKACRCAEGRDRGGGDLAHNVRLPSTQSGLLIPDRAGSAFRKMGNLPPSLGVTMV